MARSGAGSKREIEGIASAPGPIFSANQGFQNFIRLNFGNPWTDKIETAQQQLGQVMDQLQDSAGGANQTRVE